MVETEIKIGDKVIWIENGIEETIILTPDVFYSYTLAPNVQIKQWEEQNESKKNNWLDNSIKYRALYMYLIYHL